MASPASRAGWIRQGRFGLMVGRPLPTSAAAAVDAFDLDRFMADFRRTGAAWLIFPAGSDATRCDLALEIAGRARRACRKFIAYLPVDARSRAEHGQEEFIREAALRFGDLLDGWWFDGVPSQPEWYLDAARAGNPAAAVTFNDGSFCAGSARPAVAEQDYLSGETEALVQGKVRFGRAADAPLLEPATHNPQPPPGCLWHALIPIDCNWAHGAPFAPGQQVTSIYHAPNANEMEPPMYDTADLETVVRDFKAAGGAVTFNTGIYQGGRLGEATVAQLAELAARLSARRG